ncbi:MAG: ABC transporter permease, partial [Candidatus Omnitrophota bacterium]
MIVKTGKTTIELIKNIKGVFGLFGSILYWTILGPFKGKAAARQSIFNQMIFAGLSSTLIVFFVTIFTGIVLAMQSAYQLQKMGA